MHLVAWIPFTAESILSVIRDISVAEISIAYISRVNLLIGRVLIPLAYMLNTCPSSCSVMINYLLDTTFG